MEAGRCGWYIEERAGDVAEYWQEYARGFSRLECSFGNCFFIRKFIARRWCLVLTVVIELSDNGLVFYNCI
jgi:hypothetical protein